MYEYKLLESTTPASAEQLSELSLEGWKLQLILQWKGKYFYHLIRDKMSALRKQYEYYTLLADAPASMEQLEKLSEERWKLQEVIWWEGSIYYYMVRDKITNIT